MNYCKTCEWRDNDGYCCCPKIYEGGYNLGPAGEDEKSPDHMVYSYYEGGYFWVGEKFGCVHHKEKR